MTSDWPALLAAWEALLLDLDVQRYRVLFRDGNRQTVLVTNYPFNAEGVGEVGAAAFRFPTPWGPELVITLAGISASSAEARTMIGGPAAAFAMRLLQLPEFRTIHVADAPQGSVFTDPGKTWISFRSP